MLSSPLCTGRRLRRRGREEATTWPDAKDACRTGAVSAVLAVCGGIVPENAVGAVRGERRADLRPCGRFPPRVPFDKGPPSGG